MLSSTYRSAVIAAALILCTPALAAPTADEQRQQLRSMAQATLDELYRIQPQAKKALAKAAGYAVFSNVGMKFMVAGGGSGRGIAVRRQPRQETFMRMVEVQAGLGFHISKDRLVWVFERQSDLDRFVNEGWEIGAQSTVSAQAGGQGSEIFSGAMSISPGVWLYQLSGEGLALDLTATGTKYYKDKDLN